MRSACNSAPDYVRIALIILPPECWPILVERVCGLTMVWCDPRGTRKELTDALILNLTDREMLQVRRAYDHDDHGELKAWTQSDGPCLLWVPPSLRTRGAPALQGGAELERRRREGPMTFEITCAAVERTIMPSQPKVVDLDPSPASKRQP